MLTPTCSLYFWDPTTRKHSKITLKNHHSIFSPHILKWCHKLFGTMITAYINATLLLIYFIFFKEKCFAPTCRLFNNSNFIYSHCLSFLSYRSGGYLHTCCFCQAFYHNLVTHCIVGMRDRGRTWGVDSLYCIITFSAVHTCCLRGYNTQYFDVYETHRIVFQISQMRFAHWKQIKT